MIVDDHPVVRDGLAAFLDHEREIAGQLLDGVPIGCFPDLYGALAGNMPDQVITL